jgi:mRNA interferase RelE/StbE
MTIMDTLGTKRTPCSVLLSPAAVRDLAALDKPAQRRVVARIEALASNPRPPGVTKLQGEANAWRIRVGDYRVLYTIEDGRRVVLVVRIGHRREVYKWSDLSKPPLKLGIRLEERKPVASLAATYTHQTFRAILGDFLFSLAACRTASTACCPWCTT